MYLLGFKRSKMAEISSDKSSRNKTHTRLEKKMMVERGDKNTFGD